MVYFNDYFSRFLRIIPYSIECFVIFVMVWCFYMLPTTSQWKFYDNIFNLQKDNYEIIPTFIS